MTTTCNDSQCFCCGKGHFCDPPSYPESVGELWTCDECKTVWTSFEVTRARVPQGTLGWTTKGSH